MKTSIVMAVFKGGDFLRSQIESILKGSVLPDEFIFIDDCPESRSLSVINEFDFSGLGVNVLYVENEINIGPTLSFKKGVLESSGEIIFFCDQDDYWKPEKMQRLINVFRKNQKVKLVYSNAIITNERMQPTGQTVFSTRKRADLKLGQNRLPDDFLYNPDIKGCMMAVDGFFAREVFSLTSNNFANYWGHDHWIALFAYGLRGIYVVDESLFFHRFHRDNVSFAAKINFFNIRQLKRVHRLVKNQNKTYDLERFQLLLLPDFSQYLESLYSPLNNIINLEIKRSKAREMWLFIRFLILLKLLRSGFYSKYRNGALSFFRDLLS